VLSIEVENPDTNGLRSKAINISVVEAPLSGSEQKSIPKGEPNQIATSTKDSPAKDEAVPVPISKEEENKKMNLKLFTNKSIHLELFVIMNNLKRCILLIFRMTLMTLLNQVLNSIRLCRQFVFLD
jgi:hypothetical protein